MPLGPRAGKGLEELLESQPTLALRSDPTCGPGAAGGLRPSFLGSLTGQSEIAVVRLL